SRYLKWDLSVLIFLVFNTWFFLAGVPDLSVPSAPADYPRILRNFCQFILCPLVLLYAFVVLLAVAKVLLAGEKVEGNFAWIAVLGMLIYLLISPLDRVARWATFYSKIYFCLLLPFVALQISMLAKNPMENGLDESNYYLWVLSVWMGITALY